MVGHLLPVPAAADSEQEAPPGELIETRDLLGGVDRVVLDNEADAGADEQLGRRQRRSRQGDEGIQGVPVLLGQLTPGRLGRLPAGRDVRMLCDPERLEATLLDGGPELGHGDRVIGREDRNAKLHGPSLTGTTLSLIHI